MTIGETYDPLGAHLDDPYPFYARAREEEPVFYSPVLDAWVVTRYDDLVTVLRDPVTYSSGNVFPRVLPVRDEALAALGGGYPQRPDLIQSDGELHARLRAPIADVLRPDRVAALEPHIRERAAELAEGLARALEERGGVEFMEHYAVPLPCQTMGRLCGFDEERSRAAYAALVAATSLGSSPLGGEEQVAAAREWVTLQRIVGEVVRERRADPRDDAFSEVVAATVEGDGPLGDDEEARLVANLIQLVIAGHITTVPLLGNAVTLLLTHRDEWERLCADPSLIPGAVEEILRYGTPASGLYRDVTADTVLGGVALPEGGRVALRYTAANRDPAKFDAPETFTIDRRPNRHLAFGRGVHFCAGAQLGKLQLQVTLETLTARLPGLRLAGPVRVRPVLDVRHPRAVPLTW